MMYPRSSCRARSRPSVSCSSLTRSPMISIDHLQQDEAHDAAVDQGRDNGDELNPDLGANGHSLFQPGAAEARVGEDAGEDGADDAGDAVHAPDVERIVITQAPA